MKGRGSMRRFSVKMLALVSVLLVAGKAEAQMIWPFGPPVIYEVSPEVWRPVTFAGTVSYQLDGHVHYVTDGAHWQARETESALCTNEFVEPFNSWGGRVVKSVRPLPGTEWCFQHGIKTYSVRNGETYFATWVSRAGEIVQVWVKIEKVITEPAAVEPTPVEEPAHLPLVIEPSPMDFEEVIPQRQELLLPPSLPPVPPAQ